MVVMEKKTRREVKMGGERYRAEPAKKKSKKKTIKIRDAFGSGGNGSGKGGSKKVASSIVGGTV